MEYNTLLDVPKQIREFYHEEIRSEQVFEEDGITPVLSPETYVYIDENGDEQEGTKYVPTFEDVVYIVKNSTNDLKSWTEVKAVIANVKGGKETFVEYCIEKAIEADKYKFCNEWENWNVVLEDLLEAQANYTEPTQEEIEGGAQVIDYAAKIAVQEAAEPVKPTTTLEKWKTENYALLRKAAYGTVEEQLAEQLDGTWAFGIVSKKLKYPSSLDAAKGNLKNKIWLYWSGKMTETVHASDNFSNTCAERNLNLHFLSIGNFEGNYLNTPIIWTNLDGQEITISADNLEEFKTLYSTCATDYQLGRNKMVALIKTVDTMTLEEVQAFDLEAAWTE